MIPSRVTLPIPLPKMAHLARTHSAYAGRTSGGKSANSSSERNLASTGTRNTFSRDMVAAGSNARPFPLTSTFCIATFFGELVGSISGSSRLGDLLSNISSPLSSLESSRSMTVTAAMLFEVDAIGLACPFILFEPLERPSVPFGALEMEVARFLGALSGATSNSAEISCCPSSLDSSRFRFAGLAGPGVDVTALLAVLGFVADAVCSKKGRALMLKVEALRLAEPAMSRDLEVCTADAVLLASAGRGADSVKGKSEGEY